MQVAGIALEPEPIAQLQRQLDQFRSTQPRRTKLPESLWQAAVELARQHGVYSVAHPLRLDYTGLKKRIGGVPRRRKATKPAFVELIAPDRAPLEECVKTRFPGVCSCSGAAAGARSDCSAMTARDTGWRRSGFPREGSYGGRKGPERPSHWRPMRHSC